ncbi:DNA polymerase sigma [Pyrobaculum oguniense TE7]|uniref:DNA polymerase sigma n=1 Tax=Pyrobaculum oguniense (strain DSM 13380 / JCM 10595 / TE7) TaxID=698757 RepID=H6QAX1_PYROT|nr:DNA polymerase sigma [Pyrobaculum oguniense TE7]
MPRDVFVEYWLRRREVLSNLSIYLAKIKEAVLELDPQAEVYLFGSFAKGTARPDSDVDILVVSDKYGSSLGKIAELLVHVEKRLGFAGVFEIHVATRELYETWYKRFVDIKIKL